MNYQLEEIEKKRIEYKRKNRNFIREIDKVYMDYRKRYKDNQYNHLIITEDIKGTYNSYGEFITEYMLKEAIRGNEEADIRIGWGIYYDLFGKFMSRCKEQIDSIKRKYNKGYSDVVEAYKIKTIWDFYIGFGCEGKLNDELQSFNIYTDSHITEQQKSTYDLKNSIDKDIKFTMSERRIGLQLKQISYIYTAEEVKAKHIKKQKEWLNKIADSSAYFIMCSDLYPLRHIREGYFIEGDNLLKNKYKAKEFIKGSWDHLFYEMALI